MLYYVFIDLFRKVKLMRKLTPEERAAKKTGQVSEVAVAAEPKKKAKKVVDAEPVGIGADSFVMSSAKSVEAEAPAVEEKDEKIVEPAPLAEEDSPEELKIKLL
jgi:hypothetical protein